MIPRLYLGLPSCCKYSGGLWGSERNRRELRPPFLARIFGIHPKAETRIAGQGSVAAEGRVGIAHLIQGVYLVRVRGLLRILAQDPIGGVALRGQPAGGA